MFPKLLTDEGGGGGGRGVGGWELLGERGERGQTLSILSLTTPLVSVFTCAHPLCY